MIRNMMAGFIILLASGFLQQASADTVKLAVASNFAYTAKLLAKDFSEQTGHRLRISSASTGKLYTQIKNGAPFDIFMAADTVRPELLVSEGLAVKGSDHVYAQGKIVLLSNIESEGECSDVLKSPSLRRLSIANPATAPYGAAAREVLEKLSLWQKLQPRVVKGENIAQTLQFISTRNAEAGFVAKSMLNMGREIAHACIWDIPVDMYSPISQKMVLLKSAADVPAASAFIDYIRSPSALKIIRDSGYNI